MPLCIDQYEKLREISIYSTYSNNQLKDCVLNEKIELPTPLGMLIPQYEHASVRRKYTYSISFYPTGSVRRIALQDQTYVETTLGKLPAELIIFYESGNIKKLFPLNGHISAYWDENDEYGLAENLCLNFPFGSLNAKIIGIGFFENGTVKSITLWPNETIQITTPIGEQQVRIGFSLYPNGKIKSFEPANPINIMTPIGLIKAFDKNASGITGDKNSLNFNDDGSIKSLITSNTKITVQTKGYIVKEYSPCYIREMQEHEIFFKSLKIDFDKSKIRFNDNDEYVIEDTLFHIEPYKSNLISKCSDCSNCSQCSNTI